MRPVRLLRTQAQDQRGAGFGVRLLLDDKKNRRRVLDGAAKTKPHLQRNVADHVRRRVAQIERDQAEAAALNQQIRCAQRLIDIAAANPKELLEFHTPIFGGMWIEGIARIDERANFRGSRSRGQRGYEQAGPSGARRAIDFCEAAAWEASGKLIDGRRASRDLFYFYDRLVGISKRAYRPGARGQPTAAGQR